MAFENETGSGMFMPVAPAYGGNNGFGGFGGDLGLFILLLLVFGGGWGGGFGGGFGGMYPWMNQAEITTNGFQNAATNTALSGIQSSITNGFAQAEISNNARQMADMNQVFGLQSALQSCCCENRLGIANLGADIAREACADRASVSDALRDVIAANTASTQRILDQMCNDKIDAKNEKIADLERQLTMANLAASQNAQTSRILADNAAQTVALEQYLNPTPVPAYMVQNPNCCTNTCGCGA